MDSIVIEMVGKRHGSTSALRDISLEIGRGEVFGIFGRAGVGKTSLIRLIAGLDHASVGSLFFQSTTEGDQSWLRARTAAALQKPGLAPELTVNENLLLASSLWSNPRKGRTGRIAMFTELLGLTDVRARRAGALSDGMKAAAEIARALVARAEITLIDGLIERLDRPTRRRLWEHIKVSKRRGATFIIATTSADDAELCDRLAVLSRGSLAFIGGPEELRSVALNETVVVESIQNPLLKSKLKGRFGAAITERNGSLEFTTRSAETDAAKILTELHSDVGCVYVRQSTLDDALDRIEGG